MAIDAAELEPVGVEPRFADVVHLDGVFKMPKPNKCPENAGGALADIVSVDFHADLPVIAKIPRHRAQLIEAAQNRLNEVSVSTRIKTAGRGAIAACFAPRNPKI